ncbi:MAG: fused response regulator/phosphatase [bacterium]
MRNPRFLILDADPSNRRNLGIMLNGSGSQVDEPDDPSEAVKLISTGGYDCVLVDRDLPGEWRNSVGSGFKNENPPMIFITGPAKSDPKYACLIGNPEGYIRRAPESTDNLVDHLKRLIANLPIHEPGQSPKENTAQSKPEFATIVGDRIENTGIIVRTSKIDAPGPLGDILSVCAKGDDRYAILLGDYTLSCDLVHVGHLGIKNRIDMYLAETKSPSRLLEEINEEFIRLGHLISFMTASALFVDIERKTVSYSAAGHLPPLRRKWGYRRWTPLPSDGIPLGIKSGMKYPEMTMQLCPGDKILLFSDGILKIRSRNGSYLQYDDLVSIIDQLPTDAAPFEVMEAIEETVESLLGSGTVQDEITATIVQL